jgi:hypothetical protein
MKNERVRNWNSRLISIASNLEPVLASWLEKAPTFPAPYLKRDGSTLQQDILPPHHPKLRTQFATIRRLHALPTISLTRP